MRYQSDELSDGRAFTDTLRFNLRDRDGDLVWLEVDSRNARERTFLLLDPGRIADGAELLDALLRLVRIGPEGQMVEEPIEQHRESRVVQRHFQDAFAEPTLERRALPDTLLSGEPAPREYLALTETREEHSPLGSTVLVLRSELLAEVVVSPRMPLFGVLWARNRTQVTSRTERDGEVLDRGRRSPPLYNELVLRCLDYGTDGPVGIPGALRP